MTLRAVPDPPRTPREIALGEEALVDALNALETWPESDAEYLPELAEQVEKIRRRLPDRGARVEAERAGAIRYERGWRFAQDPDDSTRLRRLNGPGGEAYPKGPLSAGVVASALAVALAMVGAA